KRHGRASLPRLCFAPKYSRGARPWQAPPRRRRRSPMLYDRVALITSATRFAGKPTARAMLDAGAKVICQDASFIQPAARKAFEAEIAGVSTVPGQTPLAIAAEAEAFHDRIDILINNDAFPAIRAPIEEAKMEDYR